MQGQNEQDQEFINTMLLIEQNYGSMNKHQRIRIELWTKKLCQVTTNEVWKKNRNLYGKILLQQVLKSTLSEPFDKRPPEGALLKLNKYQISFNPQGLKENKRTSYPKIETNQLQTQNPNLSHNLFQQNQQNNENIKLNLNYTQSQRSQSRSPFEPEDQNNIQQINEQQKTINFQQAQISQLSQFNEKLYLDRTQDPQVKRIIQKQSNSLKNDQDSLFQWMHEQSQMLFSYQQEEQNQQQVNMLEQIDEQEEDQDLNTNDRNLEENSNLDMLMYLESFEQKGTNLKKATEQMLNNHFGATQQINFNR